LTGVPLAPTAAAATSTDQIATTAFVKANIPAPLTVALGGTGATTLPVSVNTLANGGALLFGHGTAAVTASPYWGLWTPPTVDGGLVGYGAGTQSAPYIETGISGGTMAAPTATPLNVQLAWYGGDGYTGSSWQTGGSLAVTTTELWSATARGCKFVVALTPNGTTAFAPKMTLEGTGNLILAAPLGVTSGGTGSITMPLPTQSTVPGTYTAGLLTGAGTAPITTHPAWGTYDDASDAGLLGYVVGREPYIDIGRAQGVPGSPSAVNNGTELTGLFAAGYDGAAYRAAGYFRVMAVENWTTAAHGARFEFITKQPGTTGVGLRMSIGNGVVVGGPTGGERGLGTLNAEALYANNVLLTSDARLKRDIAPLPRCLDLVAAIEPKMFRHLPPGPPPPVKREHHGEIFEADVVSSERYDRRSWGFIAQDVAEAMRAAGHDFGGLSDEGDVQFLSYDNMIAVLWQAVRELAARR
jgi:hypothetical protein